VNSADFRSQKNHSSRSLRLCGERSLSNISNPWSKKIRVQSSASVVENVFCFFSFVYPVIAVAPVVEKGVVPLRPSRLCGEKRLLHHFVSRYDVRIVEVRASACCGTQQKGWNHENKSKH
jgi:hypothetical protein